MNLPGWGGIPAGNQGANKYFIIKNDSCLTNPEINEKCESYLARNWCTRKQRLRKLKKDTCNLSPAASQVGSPIPSGTNCDGNTLSITTDDYNILTTAIRSAIKTNIFPNYIANKDKFKKKLMPSIYTRDFSIIKHILNKDSSEMDPNKIIDNIINKIYLLYNIQDKRDTNDCEDNACSMNPSNSEPIDSDDQNMLEPIENQRGQVRGRDTDDGPDKRAKRAAFHHYGGNYKKLNKSKLTKKLKCLSKCKCNRKRVKMKNNKIIDIKQYEKNNKCEKKCDKKCSSNKKTQKKKFKKFKK